MEATTAGFAPEIAEAERYDSAGRHDDAINSLARAAKRGDVEATTRLAKRLIVGDRAPLLARDGVDLLQQAASRGGAEAAGRLAVLAAAAANGVHDWRRAIELMVVAAERGWKQALDQLAVLVAQSAASSSSDAGTRPAAEDPRALGAAIDVTAFGTVPSGDTRNDNPLIRVFPSFVTRETCAWLIARSEGKLVRARVYDPVGKRDIVDRTRTNTAAGFNLIETDLVHLMVQTRMAAASGHPVANMEGATVLHYAVGEEITPHFDFVDPATPGYAEELREKGQRVMTFLVYLNEDYGGGETDFPRLGLRHKGRLGEGLFFVNAHADNEPDTRMIHAGLPPTSGEKWLLSQFVRSTRVLRMT